MTSNFARATFIHCRSESGDDFYYSWSRYVDDIEINLWMDTASIEYWGEDPDLLEIIHIERCQRAP